MCAICCGISKAQQHIDNSDNINTCIGTYQGSLQKRAKAQRCEALCWGRLVVHTRKHNLLTYSKSLNHITPSINKLLTESPYMIRIVNHNLGHVTPCSDPSPPYKLKEITLSYDQLWMWLQILNQVCNNKMYRISLSVGWQHCKTHSESLYHIRSGIDKLLVDSPYCIRIIKDNLGHQATRPQPSTSNKLKQVAFSDYQWRIRLQIRFQICNSPFFWF